MSARYLLIALAILFSAAPSRAQLLLEENFPYNPGTALVGQGGWAQTGTVATNPIQVTANNLTFSGYPSVSGEAVSLQNTGQDVNRAIAQQTSGAVYAAFLVRVSAAGGSDYFFHLTANPITNNVFVGRVFARSPAAGFVQFGVGKTSGTGSSVTYAQNAYALNSTVLVVLKYQFVAGGTTNDVTSIYTFAVGDDYSTEPTTPSATNSGGTDAANVALVGLRQGGGAVAPTLVFDGLRVSTSYADAVSVAPTGFTFVQPTAGQTFRAGGKLKPIWETTPDGAAGNVTVTLRKAGVDVATLYNGPNLEQPDFGDARYTIPTTIAGGTDYTVYISLNANPAVNAESAPFTILAGAVTVTSPAGGETFTAGQTATVTFAADGIASAPTAQVFLRQAGQSGKTLLATEAATDGSVEVTIPGDAGGSDFFFLVRVSDGTITSSGKSGVFTIQGAPIRAAAPQASHFRHTATPSTRESYLAVATDGLTGELGVFAGDRLVGSALVAGASTEVVVFGADLEDGEALTLRHFDARGERELAATSVRDLDGRTAALAFEDLAELTVETAKGETGAAVALAVAASPNPAAGAVTVRVSAPATVAVYDVLGRMVADLGTVETDAQWDASGAAPGVYVVRATTETGATSVRVTVAR